MQSLFRLKLMLGSPVMSNCFLYLPCRQKWEKVSFLSSNCSSSSFFRPRYKRKGNFHILKYIQRFIEGCPPSLQLDAINLKHKTCYKANINRRLWENSRNASQALSKCNQNHMLIDLYQYLTVTYLCERHFQR